MNKIDIYGTIGPACSDFEILKNMFIEGLTGVRLNTSHVSLKQAADTIDLIKKAASLCNIEPKILIDMQGPELRIGRLDREIVMKEEDSVVPGEDFAIPEIVYKNLKSGMELLLDDGKILLEMLDDKTAIVRRQGILKSGKSLAVVGSDFRMPTMTDQDMENISDAVSLGVTGVMQPFVRDEKDLKIVRRALDEAGGEYIKLFAKIENMSGVEKLESFFEIADEIVIARGDLGNATTLQKLPRVQKAISKACRGANVPFMVVTEMLSSMMHSAVPTRAEVSDIYNAVCDGCSSVMVTGETAVGDYPVEVIRYLAQTVNTYFE